LTRIRWGERIDHFETVRQRKHGSLIVVSLTISPFTNEQGKIVGPRRSLETLQNRSEARSKSPRSRAKQNTEARTCLRTYRLWSIFRRLMRLMT
jgi:hypothetical protein